jgi:Na+-transporting NADH:ubiquinone oxidoreductase subunit C
MKKNSPLYVVGFMIVLCAVCGAAIATVQFMMKPLLDANDRLVRNRTIARVYGITVTQQTAAAYDSALSAAIAETTVTANGQTWELFTGKNPPHEPGFVFGGLAFWDYVSGIVVLSHDLSHIRAIDFIDQKETPGLGARIEEKAFKDQFRDYPVAWDRPQNERIKFGENRNGKRLDAITGASQTSIALERILNDNLAAFKAMRNASVKTSGKE